MKEWIKKSCMLLFSASLLINSLTSLSVFAEETVAMTENQEINETEGNNAEEDEIEETVVTSETIDSKENVDIEQTNDLNEESVDESEEDIEDIIYEIVDVSIQTSEVYSGEKQSIRITMNNCDKITKATLKGFAEDKGAEVEYELTFVEENVLIFEVDHGLDGADKYSFTSLTIETEKGVMEFDLGAYKDRLTYFVRSDEKGSIVESGISFFSENQFTGKYGNDGRFVIVLDPGHDPGCNTRDWINGVWETDLNWKIALAMKAELEKYEGVEVYINREWSECPEESDGMDCLKARVTRAVNLQADLLISLHNNALGSGSLQYGANGTEIYISKYSDYYLESKGLAEIVERKLSEMGLESRGIRTRDYGSDGGWYDDGNSWDYYAINRHSTMMGIPSLLIEHAYMDNPGDLLFLRDSTKVDEMGRRDAQAIVEYYGLQYSKENGEISVTATTDGRFDIEITNVSAPYGIDKICVPVWSEKNGQDDIVWYEASRDGNRWIANVKGSEHKYDSGVYQIHLYVCDTAGVMHGVKSTSTEISVSDLKKENGILNVVDKQASGDFKVQVEDVHAPYEISKVYIPIWSNKNGQDDLVWYEAQRKGNVWNVSVDVINHKLDEGKYNIHLYYVEPSGKMHFISSTTHDVAIDKNLKPVVSITSKDNVNGSFTVEITNLRPSYSIGKVYVPVWSEKDGQDDLVWYVADKVGSTKWKVDVKAGNHKYMTGTYHVHSYAEEPNGTLHFIQGTTIQVQMDMSKAERGRLSVVDNGNGSFTITISDINAPYDIKNVRVPVWSDRNGQDDLDWYIASRNGDAGSLTVNIKNHKNDTGKYNIHLYYEDMNGVEHYMNETAVIVK